MAQLSSFDLQVYIAALKSFRGHADRLMDRPDTAKYGAEMRKSRKYRRAGEMLEKHERELEKVLSHEV